MRSCCSKRAFRQASQLAESQKSAQIKHLSIRLPPPPANNNWRKGAEGVKFSEKNAGFASLGLSLGGRGSTALEGNSTASRACERRPRLCNSRYRPRGVP